MIYRSNIEKTIFNEEEKFDITWSANHPGDDIEQHIKTVFRSPMDLSPRITIYHNHLIFTSWNENRGISLIVNPLEKLTQAYFLIAKWVQLILYFLENDEILDVFEFPIEDQIHEEMSSDIDKSLKEEWFTSSLLGGEIKIGISNPSFQRNISSLFQYFPWLLLFDTSVKLDDNDIVFKVPEVDSDFDDIENIYQRILKDDEQFWYLIFKQIHFLKNIKTSRRREKWLQYLTAIHKLTLQDQSLEQKFKYVADFKDSLPDLDNDFAVSYLKKLIIDTSDHVANANLCHNLLDLARILSDMDLVEFAKLAEGTALEKSLNIDNPDKREVILELTRRSKKWGHKQVIAFIQSLNDLISNYKENRKILSLATDIVEDDLKQSWEGYICIVESNIITEEYESAIYNRLEASSHIFEKSVRAEDILNGLKWILHVDVSSDKIFDIAEPYIKFAIIHSESSIDLVNTIVQTSIEHSKEEFVQYILKMVRKSRQDLNLNFVSLINTLTPHIYSGKNLLKAQLELKLLEFENTMVSNKSPIDESFKIIGEIYNSINPNESESKKLLNYITKELISIGTNYQSWPIIDEAGKRFILMHSNDKEAKNIIFQNYVEIVSNWENDVSELQENDVRIRLINEAIDLADTKDRLDIILEIIPTIKNLAIKTRSYDFFTNVVILEIKLNHNRDNEWINQMEKDVKTLLSKDKIVDVNLIFSEIFSLEISENQKYKLLELQLNIAENEPDILSANEIYEKRMELMELVDVDDIDHQFYINNYREGISELISKGDTQHLNDLVIDALDFCLSHDLDYDEFSDILIDSFENYIYDYKTKPQKSSYSRIIHLWRHIYGSFLNDLKEQIIILGCKIIQTNLAIYENTEKKYFIRRAQLIFKELLQVIEKFEKSLDYEKISILIDTTNNLIRSIESKHPDFGSIEAIRQFDIFSLGIKLDEKILQILDRITNRYIKLVSRDKDALSSLFLLLYVIARFSIKFEQQLPTETSEKLDLKTIRIIKFLQILDINHEVNSRLENFLKLISSTPIKGYRIFLTSLNEYMEYI